MLSKPSRTSADADMVRITLQMFEASTSVVNFGSVLECFRDQKMPQLPVVVLAEVGQTHTAQHLIMPIIVTVQCCHTRCQNQEHHAVHAALLQNTIQCRT
jgi:hypothetical protein